MGEQSSQTITATAVQATTTSVCPHPEAVGTRWGDPITEERQAELRAVAEQQKEWVAKPDAERGNSLFKDVKLTAADVYWLAEQSGRDDEGGVPNLHLEGADLSWTHLEGVVLYKVHLEGANLNRAYLEQARLNTAHLENARLHGTNLEGTNLGAAHLEQAGLNVAHLEGAVLGMAELVGAVLGGAHLQNADLMGANLEGASLYGAHLEGSDLSRAQLSGASLQQAWLDSRTVLTGTALDATTILGDIQWSGVGTVNLSQIDWGKVTRLGDKQGVELRSKAVDHEAVVRAYRQLAAQLRAQGMNEVADRFLYRSQVLQRRVLLRRLRIPQYLGSWLLDLISGYGYRPMRSFITYVLVILAFAAAYFTIGGANGQSLSWNEAIVISMTAFHGRGFFSAVFQPGDLQAAVAAVEAFIGLLIEIVFIATFTQRFFAR